MSIWRFADLIVEVPPSARITLGEGNTPLVRSRRIGPAHNLRNLLFKLESSNPSGSYKDRFAAAAISVMIAEEKNLCLATSSGNTGAALAAYCAAAGIACEIIAMETAPAGKLTQMLVHGAQLRRVRGFGLDNDVTRQALARLQRRSASPGAALQISAFCYSPQGMTGIQTIAYELAEQAGQAGVTIDRVFSPAGGGGLTLAIARGFETLVNRGQSPRSPAIHCVQPAGNNTIAGPLRSGANRAMPVVCTSRISGLQVPGILDGDEVVRMCRSSQGTGHWVEDEQIWQAQALLAREEGILSEPAGAVALAGALQAASRREINQDDRVVCLVTGTGFKDLASLETMIGDHPLSVMSWNEL